MQRLRCDNCGTFNPRTLGGNPRLCGEPGCATPDGFYSMHGEPLRANGKINLWRLQFPFRIEWRGWWTFWSRPSRTP